MGRSHYRLAHPMVLLAAGALLVAGILLVLGHDQSVAILATGVIAFVVAVTAKDMIKHMMRGHWGLDILAVVAMVATVLVGEYLAGLIIVLMLTGGEALEKMAENKASRELDTLISRAPAFAHRRKPQDGQIVRIPVDDVQVGDVLLVRSSEVLPVDGVVLSERATVDESSVTGEPIPVTRLRGAQVLSGAVNGSETFSMRATATAADSHYASIVQLVREAVASRAPIVRLADRYAVPFTAVSLLIAGIAWYLSGDPVRFAEVLVVATPCPLLIAAPVAFMGGMSSAARVNVIVKEGGTSEKLARLRAAGLDKTGTLTQGRPVVTGIRGYSRSAADTLAHAAAAEQYSVHVFAEPIIRVAREQGLDLPPVRSAEELATNGVAAVLADGSEVRVGKARFVQEVTDHDPELNLEPGVAAVHVAVAGKLAGVLLLSDPVREDASETLKLLREQGITDIFMVTGDVESTARSVGDAVGIQRIYAEMTPQQKVEVVQSNTSRPVLMVGDGINDAPVLAASDVGVAMGARGATAASESASAVITSDSLARLPDVIDISKRTVRIALQSIWLGIVISVALMLVAAVGYLPAVAGALLQEVVDLVAIVSALRALSTHKKVPSVRRNVASPELHSARPGAIGPS
ncbi:heavy metal translocating P-type ATPase [Nesterenkonia sphaerica]|uniref:Cadmium-translocating P-type ATPase n=1 Tax=Nesterenkonia sphaerica TaxID=1804988 RepID=A0A5R9AL84_9MICC|nr:heavy metal translocating P-type ATPase [Nesterenkonia sphaerica]TLP79461.1 cadmium-translocating P-type ATPase [Nesterenkonia sphaerica]